MKNAIRTPLATTLPKQKKRTFCRVVHCTVFRGESDFEVKAIDFWVKMLVFIPLIFLPPLGPCLFFFRDCCTLTSFSCAKMNLTCSGFHPCTGMSLDCMMEKLRAARIHTVLASQGKNPLHRSMSNKSPEKNRAWPQGEEKHKQ